MTDLFWRFDLDELFSAEDLDQEALAREAEERERMRESRKEEKKDERAPLSGRKLYIVDGYSLIYRSYFAFLTHPLTDSEGNNVSAFFGFFNTVFMLIRDYKFDYFVIAMDSKGPTFRHRMYPEYKANREAAPQDLHSQVPLIMDALEKLNIPYIAQEGYEADDLIATLAANASRLGVETVMVTGDKDLLQLVDDRVGALRPPKKNQPKYTLFGPEEVKEEFGIAPTQIVDYLSLLGDSSDNVPGVKGIGEKGAVKLLEEYVSLDGIYRHLDSLSKGLRAKLEEGKESAYLSRDLVRLKSDVFRLDSFDDDRFLTSTIDYAHAVDIFKKHNCFSLAKSAAAMARKGEEPSSPARTAAVEEDMEETAQKDVTKDPSLIGLGEYQVLKDIKTVRAYFEEARRAAGHIAFDIETSDLDTAKAELVGFSFSYGKKKAFYCPLKAAEGTFLALDDVMALFNEYFSTGKLKVIGQNIKFDLEVLSHLGLEGMEIEADTMIYAWLLDSASSSYSLESLALRYLSYEAIAYDDIVPKGADFSAVPLESAMRYGAEDSDLTYRLYLHLGKELEERDLMRVFRDYELPLIPVLARMEMAGVLLDKDFMRQLDGTMSARQEDLEKRIIQLAGHEFNINSTQQLAKVLFEELGLQAGRKTQRGYSTATETLEGLRGEHPIIEDILAYRQVSKLLGTYIDTLPQMTDGEGRIHSSFLQTGTATGRLSSKNPNLQNIPIRSEDGRLIRSAFIAGDGCRFLSADYSQIELVMLAHVSGDEELGRAFREGGDVHRYTASLIFDKKPEEVEPAERRIAKTINFGIMYGMSPFRLSGELGISRADAKTFIDRYFERYAQVRSYVDKVVRDAEEKGYVRTLGGHMRTVVGINSRNKNVKAAAERIALNTIIQGSAAELMKKAMAALDGEMRRRGLASRMLLQVHDELIFEVPVGELEEMRSLVRECMEGAAKLSVPLHVSIEDAERWGDMH